MGFLAKLARAFGLKGVSRGQTTAPLGDPLSEGVLLQGPGAFAVAVVGESHYQSAFENICGPRSPDGEDRLETAKLYLEDDNEHDREAVRVDIAGRTVGYLSRPAARDYRAYLGRSNHPTSTLLCRARIRGGWERSSSDKGHYGVWLDLPDGIPAGTPTVTSRRENRDEIRIAERVVSELLGLCKGMICDGVVTEAEAFALRAWLAMHRDASIGYPGNVLTERLDRIFADQQIDSAERDELQQLLKDLTGLSIRTADGEDRATSLPFDDPVPPIQFGDCEYVFTGRLISGSRSACERTVIARGGRVNANVRKATNYVVVGPIASRAWLESTHGRKLLRAIELRREGNPITIVSESSWLDALARHESAS